MRSVSAGSEVGRVELHGLVEVAFPHFLLHELVDVVVDLLALLLLVSLVGPVAFPPPLLLLIFFLFLVAICTLETVAQFAALDAPFEAQTVFFLALRLLARAVDEVAYTGLVSVYLFEVVDVLDVLLLYQGQHLLVYARLLSRTFTLHRPAASSHEETVLGLDAGRTALADHADFSWGEEATAVDSEALIVAAALVGYLVVGTPVEVLVLGVVLVCIARRVQE
jgi:hypothetical protein